MTDQGRWTDLFIAIGVAFALLAGLMLADIGITVLQEHSMVRPPPRYPLHPRRDFFVKSALADEPRPLCTCGPTCPTPVPGKWPIPASMEPLKGKK